MKLYIKSTTSILIPKHVYVVDLFGENHRQCYGWLKKVLKDDVCIMNLSKDNSDAGSYMLYPEDFRVVEDLGEYNSLSEFLGYKAAREVIKKYPEAMKRLRE